MGVLVIEMFHDRNNLRTAGQVLTTPDAVDEPNDRITACNVPVKFVDDIRSAGLWFSFCYFLYFCEGARCEWEERGKRNEIKNSTKK